MFKVPSSFDQFLSSVTTSSIAIGAVPVTFSVFTNLMLAKTGAIVSRLSKPRAEEDHCIVEATTAITKHEADSFFLKGGIKLLS